MSERERWVVYPILFLTLGIAIRDKIFQRVDTDNMVARRVFSEQSSSNRFWADEIYCRKLNVAQETQIGGIAWPPETQQQSYHGTLLIRDQNAQPTVVAQANRHNAGHLSTYNASGQELVSLGTADAGGLVEISQQRDGYTLDIGHLSVTGIFVRAGGKLLDWHLLYDPNLPAADESQQNHPPPELPEGPAIPENGDQA